MNPESLCAKCAHLVKSLVPYARWHACYNRNSMQKKYDCVTIEKGYMTCVNFKPNEQQ